MGILIANIHRIQIDIEPHIAVLRTSSNIEEIRLGGNSLGVEACKALADILKSKTNLKVY
jgi:Ran GTPase-activating protein 1